LIGADDGVRYQGLKPLLFTLAEAVPSQFGSETRLGCKSGNAHPWCQARPAMVQSPAQHRDHGDCAGCCYHICCHAMRAETRAWQGVGSQAQTQRSMPLLEVPEDVLCATTISPARERARRTRARQRGARTNESQAAPQRVLRISAAALPANPHLLCTPRVIQWVQEP
jgi:hypothetical protein